MPLTRRQFIVGSSAAAFASHPLETDLRIPFVDSHVHVWKHDPRFPFAAGANVPPQDASCEMLLELMRSNNVQRTVIIQVIHYKWDNRYLADVLRRHGRHFRGVCRVNPEDPFAPDYLSRLTEVDGFHGVRLSPAAGPAGDWIRGPLMGKLWRRCANLKVPMTLLIPVTRLPEIHPLLEDNPDLQVVIDHMADCPVDAPEKLELLLALARYPRVFVKISHLWSLSRQAFPYQDAQAEAQRVYQAFGADRIMAGTDWPISLRELEYERSVWLYRRALSFIAGEDKRRVLSGTAQKVWP